MNQRMILKQQQHKYERYSANRTIHAVVVSVMMLDGISMKPVSIVLLLLLLYFYFFSPLSPVLLVLFCYQTKSTECKQFQKRVFLRLQSVRVCVYGGGVQHVNVCKNNITHFSMILYSVYEVLFLFFVFLSLYLFHVVQNLS